MIHTTNNRQSTHATLRDTPHGKGLEKARPGVSRFSLTLLSFFFIFIFLHHVLTSIYNLSFMTDLTPLGELLFPVSCYLYVLYTNNLLKKYNFFFKKKKCLIAFLFTLL